jgi:hypothetical protein
MKKKAFVVLLLFTCVSACSLINNNKYQTFQVFLPIPINEMNTVIKLSIPTELVQTTGNNSTITTEVRNSKNLRADEPFTLSIQNLSTKLIIIPKESWFTILQYNRSSKQWVRIEDIIQYRPSPEDILIPPIGPEEKFGFRDIGVYPALRGITKPVEIRIFVIGTIYENGIPADRPVGAYLDVTINPSK